MSFGPTQLLALAALALAAWVLRRNLWRAVLFLAPSSIRIEADAPADRMQLPAELIELERGLKALGFVPVGSRLERPRLWQETVCYDFALPAERVFATLYLASPLWRQAQPRLYLLTPTEGGGFVITGNYRRPAREIPGRYTSGGLEGATCERLLKAHLRVREGFGAPRGVFDLDGRVAVAREWFDGPGRAEVREQNLHGLLWSVGTLGMVCAAIFGSRD